jgi:hypothetical protein
MKVIYYNETTGEITSAANAPGLDNMHPPSEGELAIMSDYSGPLPGYWNGTEVIPVPTQPSTAHIWNWVSKQWEQNIEIAKLLARARIKSARAIAETADFSYQGHVYDADPASYSKILGAAQLAMQALLLNQSWQETWTLADNTSITLSIQDMLGVGVALGTQVSSAYSTARDLLGQIDAATTIESVEAIQWPT